jgi:hypothetical protein
MKNKVCVDLIVPSIEQRYNLFLPVNKKCLEIVYLLNKSLNEMTSGSFPIRNDLTLIDADTGIAYDLSKTCLENGILNETKLILL